MKIQGGGHGPLRPAADVRGDNSEHAAIDWAEILKGVFHSKL